MIHVINVTVKCRKLLQQVDMGLGVQANMVKTFSLCVASVCGEWKCPASESSYI
jgi:hypothetical protein